MHLCLLSLNSICVSWIWGLGSGVCFLTPSEITECLLRALPLLLLAAAVCLPEPGKGTIPGKFTNQLSSVALQLLAGERDSVQAACGTPQESMIFFERVLTSGLNLNFGFALWTVSWAVGAGSTWDTLPLLPSQVQLHCC